MKRLLITLGVITAVIAPVTVAANLGSRSIGASEEPPIVQEVRHQGEVLDNHEDRITNTEADVADLQTNTTTPPSQTKVVVREVITEKPAEPIYTPPPPTPEPQPEPEPVVVTSYRQIPVDEGYNNENVDCEYTYSDGTTYRWHWKTVTYNQTKSTHISGYCDDRAIGREKTT